MSDYNPQPTMFAPTSRPFAFRNRTLRRLWILLWVLPVVLPLGAAKDLIQTQRDALRSFGRAWLQFMRRGVVPVLRFAWQSPIPPSR